jgi:hypothetical protein
MNEQHYCQEHKSRFYKNEKLDGTGQLKVWYSHKLKDGTGFCQEETQVKELAAQGKPTQLAIPETTGVLKIGSSVNGMFMCNAMNNAVSLASNGVISVDQIGSYYKRILAEFYTGSVQ